MFPTMSMSPDRSTYHTAQTHISSTSPSPSLFQGEELPSQSTLVSHPLWVVAPKDEEVDYRATDYCVDIENIRNRVFRFNSWKPRQLATINAVIEARDVFARLPTGSGKSLCYQLPVVYLYHTRRALIVIITPLLALMHEQYEKFFRLGYRPARLYHAQSAREKELTKKQLDLDPGHPQFPQILLVTPENISQGNYIQQKLKTWCAMDRVARFVIDEAHVIFEYGNNFRPSYLWLDSLRKSYPRVPITALTASASPGVIKKIICHLGIEGCILVTDTVDRPNLFYQVRHKASKRSRDLQPLDVIENFIKSKHPEKSGIIYCTRRSTAVEVAKALSAKNISAAAYHGNINAKDRQELQSNWMTEKIHVLCATISFSLGIDKSDVRFVIHYNLPASMDRYVQDTGRAGRDGQPADCLLLYQFNDWHRLYNLSTCSTDTSSNDIRDNEIRKQEIIESLHHLMRYSLDITRCRRSYILGYYGETSRRANCRACDVCLGEIAENQGIDEYTALGSSAVQLLKGIYEDPSQPRITLNKFALALSGSKSKEVRRYEYLQHYGCGKSFHIPLSTIDDAKLFCQILTLKKVFQEIPEPNPLHNTHRFYLGDGPAVEALRYGHLQIMMARTRKRKIADRPKSTGSRKKRKTGDSAAERVLAANNLSQELPLSDDEDIGSCDEPIYVGMGKSWDLDTDTGSDGISDVGSYSSWMPEVEENGEVVIWSRPDDRSC